MLEKRILIVDDEEHIREIAQATLEIICNWDVILASSGSEALTQAETEQPDAILLDVMLPDMDGVTTFQKLQANPATQQIPVVLLTAKVQATDQRRFAGLGVAAVLPKPFNPEELGDQIAAALGWSL